MDDIVELNANVIGVTLPRVTSWISTSATDFGSRHPGFLLLDHPDDLRIGGAALSHRLLPRD